MKNTGYLVLAFLLLGLSAFTFYYSDELKISKEYEIVFTSEDVSGNFKTLKGTVVFDEAHPESSSLNLIVDVNSINTGNNLKNKHARDANWFDAEKYPEITFVSRSIERKENAYSAKGTLSMHGVSKEVAIPFSFVKTDKGGVFKADFEVDRTHFNVGKPDNKVSTVMLLKVALPVLNK